MKQKKYRLLKDIDTPSLFIKAGSIAECVGDNFYVLNGEKYSTEYYAKDVEDDKEWFEEVNEEPSEDKRKKEIMKAYSDGIMIGVKFNFKPDIQTDPEKYFNENFNQ